MKTILVFGIFFPMIISYPVNDRDVRVTVNENFGNRTGNYKFSFKTSNGITQEQIGESKMTDTKTTVIIMRGYFSFVAPDNSIHEIHYVSDENGYRPKVSISSTNYVSFRNPNMINITNDDGASTRVLVKEIDANDDPLILNGTVPRIGNEANKNNTTNTTREYPDRIGTPAIITLQGGGALFNPPKRQRQSKR